MSMTDENCIHSLVHFQNYYQSPTSLNSDLYKGDDNVLWQPAGVLYACLWGCIFFPSRNSNRTGFFLYLQWLCTETMAVWKSWLQTNQGLDKITRNLYIKETGNLSRRTRIQIVRWPSFWDSLPCLLSLSPHYISSVWTNEITAHSRACVMQVLFVKRQVKTDSSAWQSTAAHKFTRCWHDNENAGKKAYIYCCSALVCPEKHHPKYSMVWGEKRQWRGSVCFFPPRAF